MNYAVFVLSLIGLCLASISAFMSAFKNRSLLLGIFVPLIALCGSFIYFSYTSVLGYPIEMTWEEMPNRITVIYFRVSGKETITLWILEKNTTRLITLRFDQKAEDGLEGERETMGQGTPVTFEKEGKDKMKDKGDNGQEGIEGDLLELSDLMDEHSEHGWIYKVESKGEPIPGGSLPPKEH